MPGFDQQGADRRTRSALIQPVGIDEKGAVIGYREEWHPTLSGHGRRAGVSSGKERQADQKSPGILLPAGGAR